MKKVFYLIFIIIENISAQWFWQNPLPQGNTLNSVKFISSNVGWAVGGSGTIMKTTNGGVTWVLQLVGHDATSFDDIAFSGANNGIVVGQGKILRTTNGGITWTEQLRGHYLFYGIEFADANNATAVGATDNFSTGIMFRTTNGGLTWTSVSIGTSNWLLGVSFVDANNGTAVGNNGTILRTTNGGAVWTSQSSGTTEQLKDVFFIDANNCFVVGARGTILRTTNGGATWTTQTSGTTSWLRSVYFSDLNKGIIVGETGFAAGYGGMIVLRTTNGGATWESQSDANVEGLLGVSLSDSINGTAVGYNGTILLTTNGGANWLPQSSGITNFLRDVTFSGRNIGYAVGEKGTILHTTNGGATWVKQVSGTTRDLGAVTFIDSINGFVVGSLGTILHTINGGETWILQSSGIVEDGLSGVSFSDSANGIVVGQDGIILLTSNGGTTWNQQPSGTTNSLFDVSFSNLNYGTAVGYNGTILRTTNGGTTWLPQLSGTTFDLPSVSFSDVDNGAIASNSGQILMTTDGGATWTERFSNGIGLYGIHFSDINIGTAVGLFGLIYRTSNGGYTWKRQLSGTSTDLYGVFFSDANYGTIVSWGGLILHTTNGGEPFVSVVSPNGGETWQAGSTQQITWNDNISEDVKIELFKGSVFNSIISSSTASNGSFGWIIPTNQTTGADYKIKITSIAVDTISDLSDNNFSIIPFPIITLNSPNGGENLVVGTADTIRWTSSKVTNVKIEYSTSGGTSWITHPIVSTTPAAAGQYVWTIPNTPSTECRVKISDVNNPEVTDSSSNNFTISPLSISLTYPNGGENLVVGRADTIRWTSSNVTNVRIEYSTNGGTIWVTPPIVSTTPAAAGQYVWTIPNTPSTECRVKISDVNNPEVTDSSSNNFTILPKSQITLTSPSGNEVWRAGTSHNISWLSVGVANVKLQYTNTDNYLSWNTIEPNYNNIGVYNWVIPNINSAYCQIRISDANSFGTADTSNVFSIFSYPSTFIIDANISFKPISDVSNYRMVSLPGLSNQRVNDFLNGTHPYDWNVYWDNGDSLNYQRQYNGTDTFTFKPGNAFWILSQNPFILNPTSVNTVPLDSNHLSKIDLHNGWNLISNPFDKKVSWIKVKQANSLDSNSLIYSWEEKQYSNPVDMEVYKGYYFNNTNNIDSLIIPYDPFALGKKLAKENLLPIFSDDLTVNLVANGESKSFVQLGIDSCSSYDFDKLDYFAPPGDFEKYSIKLVNDKLGIRDKYLFIEHRPEIGEGQIFNLEIKSVPNENIKLTLDGLLKFGEYEIYLLDGRLNRLINIKNQSELILKLQHQINPYKLLIGTDRFIEAIKNELVPKQYSLYQNYPNPFNPNTFIQYDLPQNTYVKLKIFDILGNEVETLVNQEQETGRHEVLFNAERFASGIYLYRLETESFTAVKKMVLMK